MPKTIQGPGRALKLLITGATGQVGTAVLAALQASPHELFAGVRQLPLAAAQRHLLPESMRERIQWRTLDFESGHFPAEDVDAVFLLRPPQLAQVGLFEAFLHSLRRETRIVFLSVEGAQDKSYLPHAKIEACIQKLGFHHCFLRPGYFMENLLKTLWPELTSNQRIYLPAGNLKFNWMAVSDIATAAAQALCDADMPPALSLLNRRAHSFGEVVSLINAQCGTALRYESPHLLHYLSHSLRRGQTPAYTAVMLLLHYLPRRLHEAPRFSKDFLHYCGRQPQSLETFIQNHQARFGRLYS